MYNDQYAILNELSDEQAGQLMKAVFKYHTDSIEPDLEPLMKAIFMGFKATIDRDLEKYREICKKRAENGRKGGKQTQANASKRVANQADSESVSDSDNESESEINTSNAPEEEEVSHSKQETERANERFAQFWEYYPKKKGKADARKKFDRALKKVDFWEMMEALGSQKRSHDWTKDGGQYVPNPSTWLNQERWEDEVSAQTKPRSLQDTPDSELTQQQINRKYDL